MTGLWTRMLRIERARLRGGSFEEWSPPSRTWSPGKYL